MLPTMKNSNYLFFRFLPAQHFLPAKFAMERVPLFALAVPGVPLLLAKARFTADTYELLLTDAVRIWSCHAEAAEIEANHSRFNPRIEKTVQGVTDLLNKFVFSQRSTTSFTAEFAHDRGAITLAFAGRYSDGFTFKWSFVCHALPGPEHLHDHLTHPLIALVKDQSNRISQLVVRSYACCIVVFVVW